MIDIEEHEGLVVQVARRFRFVPGVTWDDLLAAGRVGVWEAQRRFDPARGFSFSTYATFWIRQCIGRWCYQTRSTVKVPINVQEAIGRARRTGGDLGDYEKAGVRAMSTSSLHGNEGLLHDCAVDDTSLSAIGDREESDVLFGAIRRLPTREREVVQALYIDGARVREVSSRLRVSPAVVRKTRERALGRLREMLEAA